MKRQNCYGNIRKRSAHSWEGSVYINNERKYVYGKTPQDVRKKISGIVLQADLGLLAEESNMLLKDWLDQWITSYVMVKPNTLSRYEIDIHRHISPALGHIALCDLHAVHIQSFYNSLLKNGMSAKSLKNLHSVLHEALERAVIINLISYNVSNACVLPKMKQAEMHPLEGNEIARFLDAIKKDKYEDIYYVALFTGMRQGEILGLTWDSICFERNTIHLHHQLQKQRIRGGGGEYHLVELKNSEDRYIQPAPQVMTVLKRIYKEQENMKCTHGKTWRNNMNLVFVNRRGGHLSSVTVYNHLKVIARLIAKPELRFHDLRHSYATLSLLTGANIKSVSTQLGHATTAFTLDRYGHTTDQMRQDAANRMSDYIQSITAKS